MHDARGAALELERLAVDVVHGPVVAAALVLSW
jgi:hypothetical protein